MTPAPGSAPQLNFTPISGEEMMLVVGQHVWFDDHGIQQRGRIERIDYEDWYDAPRVLMFAERERTWVSRPARQVFVFKANMVATREMLREARQEARR